MQMKWKNTASLVLLTALLGAVVGLVLWLFLRAVALGTSLIWTVLPERVGAVWILVPLCTLGGLIAGLLHRRFGQYPEPLDTVLGKVRKEKHYDYHPMLPMLLCALIPLVFGASVGPEAGLTGIIAALCYWVGDNVKIAKQHAEIYSELGEAVTLGQLFHMPLFGILAVEEHEGDIVQMPKLRKLVFYGISAAAGFLVIYGLNNLFHTSMEGFPKFQEVSIRIVDYILTLVYIPVGLLLCRLFEGAEAGFHRLSGHVPAVIRETVCGLGVGLMAMALPMVLFSGEEQMSELMTGYGAYAPWFLILVCLLKLIMTAFCLSFGLRGGHFFPLIFACTCMGIGLSSLVFPNAAEHMVFAAGVVTAATLGAQMKKPLAVSVLMLLCFPARLLFWIFLAAAVSGRLGELWDRKKAPAAQQKSSN